MPRPAAAGLHRGRQGNVALSPPVRTPCLHSTFLDPYTDTPTVTVNDGGWRSPPTGRLDGETVPPASHVEARSSAQAVHHRQVVAWSSMEDGGALPGAMPDAEWSLGADGSGRTVPRAARCTRVVAAAQQRRHGLIPIAPGRQAAWGRVRLHAGQRPPAAMRTPPLRPGPAVASLRPCPRSPGLVSQQCLGWRRVPWRLILAAALPLAPPSALLGPQPRHVSNRPH